MQAAQPTQEPSREIAACGLFCGACKKLRAGKCPGCRANEKASWCTIRSCCLERGHASCADCREFADVRGCKKFNNFVGRVFGVLFNSDRAACIARLREVGPQAFAAEMAAKGLQTLPRK